ncbi:putative thiol methyltransferase 2 [Termitomyces sp. T112]|nr:putative thiol methyltransferase 2 [Termitomyces sp. T112]
MSLTDIPFVSTMPDIVKVREIVKSGNPLDWETVWQAKLTPWDAGESQPPLREVIESGGIHFPRQGRVLVPGCGPGYDVFYLASALNMDVLGLDVSETAITKAKSLMSSFGNSGTGKVSFISEDFFHHKREEQFDLIYDYGFFIVIPPTRRTEWAQQMASLIKPQGYLITLVFPIDPPTDLGPPFFVRVEHYEEVLDGSFKKVLDKVPTTSLPSHVGKERIVVWERI